MHGEFSPVTERTDATDRGLPAVVGVWRAPVAEVARGLPRGVEVVARGRWGFGALLGVEHEGVWAWQRRVLVQVMTRRVDVWRGWWTLEPATGPDAVAPETGAVAYASFPLEGAARRFLLDRPWTLAAADGVVTAERRAWDLRGAEPVAADGWTWGEPGWAWEGGWRGLRVGEGMVERLTGEMLARTAAGIGVGNGRARRRRGVAVGV